MPASQGFPRLLAHLEGGDGTAHSNPRWLGGGGGQGLPRAKLLSTVAGHYLAHSQWPRGLTTATQPGRDGRALPELRVRGEGDLPPGRSRDGAAGEHPHPEPSPTPVVGAGSPWGSRPLQGALPAPATWAMGHFGQGCMSMGQGPFPPPPRPLGMVTASQRPQESPNRLGAAALTACPSAAVHGRGDSASAGEPGDSALSQPAMGTPGDPAVSPSWGHHSWRGESSPVCPCPPSPQGHRGQKPRWVLPNRGCSRSATWDGDPPLPHSAD